MQSKVENVREVAFTLLIWKDWYNVGTSIRIEYTGEAVLTTLYVTLPICKIKLMEENTCLTMVVIMVIDEWDTMLYCP